MAIGRAYTWDGDLHHVSMRTWREESEIAATMAVEDGEVLGWTNLKFVGPSNSRLVWLWIRHAAWRRPPVDILWADDLARLQTQLKPEEA